MTVFVLLCGLFAITPSRCEDAEPLEPGCFACRCPRNLDYQVSAFNSSFSEWLIIAIVIPTLMPRALIAKWNFK